MQNRSEVPHLMKSRDQSPDDALGTLWIHVVLSRPLTFLFLSLPLLLQLLRILDFSHNSPSGPCLRALPLLWSLLGMLLLNCPYVCHLPVCFYSSILAKRPFIATHVNTTIPMPSFRGPLLSFHVPFYSRFPVPFTHPHVFVIVRYSLKHLEESYLN